MSTSPASRARAPRPGAVRRTGLRGAAARSAGAGLLFVLPMLVLFIIFRFFPTLGALGMSFTNYKLSGDFEVVGVANYVKFFENPVAINALTTTLLYALIYVPMMVVTALVTALVLQRIVWGSGFFRGALFLPYVTSFVLAGIIWTWIFNVSGPLNQLLGLVDLPAVGFLTGHKLTILTSLAAVSVWRGFGYSMLILLAGLKTIPAELYESAMIDGATAWQRFWGITLPLLRPSIFFVLVIETIGAFQVFDTIYVMTGGGPARASYSLVYHLYESGFKFFDFGYASAVGVVLFVIVFLISLVQRFLLDREVN